jgi:hypothetical protein
MKAIRRNKRGQFLVATALLIAILFISVASFLASTTVTSIKLLKDEFRRDATRISSNFYGALNLAVTEVTRELELRSSTHDYNNYSTLLKDVDSWYSETASYGIKMINEWHNAILLQYAGLSVNLNITNPIFECNWNASGPNAEFYSNASAVLSLDIVNYGFYGLKQNANSELKLRILDRGEQNQEVALTISLRKEKGLPVTDLTQPFVKILYLKNDTLSFAEADPSGIGLTYLGNGVYNITFTADDYATPAKIKMILRDGRGIIVAAITKGGILVSDVDDEVGPVTYNVLCNPNPCPSESTLYLTARVDDTTTGANYIMAAEYFIDSVGENGTGTAMSASDNYFDSPIENVKAQIQASALTAGNHTLYVHGMDAFGNWGNFSSVILEIIEGLQTMHVASINLQLRTFWFWVWCEATVTIVDSGGSPVEGARVYGQWSGSVTGSVNGMTDLSGRVTFTSGRVWSWGWGWPWGSYRFTFTVTNLVKDGWIYDEDANVETSDTVP